MKFSYPIIFSAFIIIFTIGLSSNLYSSESNDIETLQKKLANTKEDTSKVNILLRLAEETSWSDFKSSELYAKQALFLSKQTNYKKGMAYAYCRLANLFSENKLDHSEILALKSLELAKEMGDSILMASVFNVFGNLKYNLTDYEDALMYYYKALDIYLKLNMDSFAAAIYSNLGSLSAEMYDDSAAVSYFLKAAEINKKNKNFLWLAQNYMNLGNNYINFLNLNSQGFEYLNKSQAIVDEHKFNRLHPWLYNNFCSYFFKLKDYEKSIYYGEKALQAAKENSNRLQELHALLSLKDVYFQISDLKNAYSYLEQMDIVKDSINKHKRLKELDLLELKYKFEEEQNALELKTAQLDAKHYRKEFTYVLIILIAVLFVIVFLFLYITQRNRAHRKSLEQKATLLEKEKLSESLEYKNKELTTNVMYSIQRNNALSELTEELLNIEAEAVKSETKEAIKTISGKIRNSLDLEIWEEFEIRFQQVHLDFYKSLDERHNDLTPNEKRLCAFLRMNMSSKEISRITGQSLSALHMARNRLRKKLGISQSETNLVTYLSQF